MPGAGAVFTSQHFLGNLQMGPISQGVLKHSSLIDLFVTKDENVKRVPEQSSTGHRLWIDYQYTQYQCCHLVSNGAKYSADVSF